MADRAHERASGRAAARALLDAALSGVRLTAAERRFLGRLSQWDKRTSSTVASLITRARQTGPRTHVRGPDCWCLPTQAGREEAAGSAPALDADQLGTVLAALIDAVEYRTSGAASAGCWDCASMASGPCAEHAQDATRARVFQQLAAHLHGQPDPPASGGSGGPLAGAADLKRGTLRLPELSLCGTED